MPELKIGDSVPDFSLPATGGKSVSLADLRGKYVVLYFYPKDSTPGCTREGRAFADLHDEFERRGAVVLGVSRDSVRSHENFKAKQQFPFELLSDAEEDLCRQFDVIRMKNMYGKQVRGIERSTFLIDRKGVLREAWRKVQVDGHAEQVLAALDALAR